MNGSSCTVQEPRWLSNKQNLVSYGWKPTYHSRQRLRGDEDLLHELNILLPSFASADIGPDSCMLLSWTFPFAKPRQPHVPRVMSGCLKDCLCPVGVEDIFLQLRLRITPLRLNRAKSLIIGFSIENGEFHRH
jgi:hypothetical protein